MQINDIDLDFLRDCLRQGGLTALKQWGHAPATIKADHTPVTEVDRQVEQYLIERIAARYPGHAVLSEESGMHAAQSETTWIIDPIDGTRSYASGLPIWGVSIGILRAGRPLAGGLYLPVTNEMFWGTHTAAYYNDLPIPPLAPVDLQSVLTFLAVSSNFYLSFDLSFPRARSMGSTAAHLAYTTTGAAVGTLLHNISLWDIAGILPLLEAVGVSITTLDGTLFNPVDLLNGLPLRRPLLAAHPAVIEDLRKTIHEK